MRLLLLVAIVVILPAPVVAQDNGEQNDLFQRFVAGIEREEIYFSYASLVEIDFNVTFTVSISELGPITVTENTLTTTDGYVIQSRDTESRTGTVDVVYTYIDPEASRAYHLLADMVITNDTLYVDAAYLDNMGDSPDLESGWHSYSTVESIPEPLSSLDIPVLFMLETTVFQSQDLLQAVVDRIELEETELVDGTRVDEITMWINEAQLDTFFSILIRDSSQDEELLQTLMEYDDFSGEIFMLARINEDNDILEVELEVRLAMDNIPLDLVDSQAPEGGAMNLMIEYSQHGQRDSINTEFAPIEPPIE